MLQQRGKKTKTNLHHKWTASKYREAPALNRALISFTRGSHDALSLKHTTKALHFLPLMELYYWLHLTLRFFVYNQKGKKFDETFYMKKKIVNSNSKWKLIFTRGSKTKHSSVFFQAWLQWSCLVTFRVKANSFVSVGTKSLLTDLETQQLRSLKYVVAGGVLKEGETCDLYNLIRQPKSRSTQCQFCSSNHFCKNTIHLIETDSWNA